MKKIWRKFIDLFKNYYSYEEGAKRVVNTKRLKHTFSSLIGLLILVQIFMPKDDSLLGKSYKPFDESGNDQEGVEVSESGGAQAVIHAHENDARNQKKVIVRLKGPPLVYNARQVFERQDAEGSLTPLPSGTNFIGKLVNGIDTREGNQTMRVTLPYGASHPSGGSIPRESILLGTASYQGKGDRVYIRFNRAIFPSGEEFKIDAQALSSADYTPGLPGENHSQSDMRMIGSLGLTMVSAAAEVLTQKSPLSGMNQLGQVVVEPKPNLRNAALQGISQTSKEEASRHAEVAKGQEEYLTVEAGGDLIVSLLTPFKGENL